jgi:hypothetical protein
MNFIRSQTLSFMFITVAAVFAPVNLQAASLLGDHTCAHWLLLPEADQKTWVNSFIAPLSLTYKSLRKTKSDKYNDDPNAYLTAIANINAYCKAHPEHSAAQGAGAHLHALFND